MSTNVVGGVTNRRKGHDRDQKILGLVERHGALTTEQVAILAFRGMASSQRKCQQRLLRLHQKGLLERCRADEYQPYTYYLPKAKPAQLQHTLGVAWVFCWQAARQGLDWYVAHWEAPKNMGNLISDGFLGMRSSVTKEHRWWFVELDRGTNRWDKVGKYCSLYESATWETEWWVQFATRFPGVLCVAETPGRLERIRQLVASQNASKLRFELHLLDDIRREALRWAQLSTQKKQPSKQLQAQSVLPLQSGLAPLPSH
jgi:hypothetical protein